MAGRLSGNDVRPRNRGLSRPVPQGSGGGRDCDGTPGLRASRDAVRICSSACQTIAPGATAFDRIGRGLVALDEAGDVVLLLSGKTRSSQTLGEAVGRGAGRLRTVRG